MTTLAVQARRPRALGLPTNAVDFGPLVQRLAKERGPKVAAEYAAAVLKAQRDIDMAALERALRSGKAERVAQVLGLSNIQQQVGRAVAQPLTGIAQAAGQGSAALMSKHGVRARFDAVHPDVVQFARLQGSDLVTGIDKVTREVIREVIGRGAEGRLTVADQARAIREVVGLPKPWVNAPRRFEAELRAGLSSAATSRRLDAAMQQRLRKAIRTNTLTDALITEARDKYSASLIHLRARMIARTESARAASHGLQEGWKQAQRDGVLPASTRRWWIVTPDERLSRTHATIPSLNPKGRKLDEPFVTTEGLHMFPPSRPNCRCRIALTFGGGELRDAERAADAEIAWRDRTVAPLRRIEEFDYSNPLIGEEAFAAVWKGTSTSITDDNVREAFRSYSRLYYTDINSKLRTAGQLTPDEASVVARMREAFDTTVPTPQAITTYRTGLIPQANLRTGAEFTDMGFVSATTRKGSADAFFIEQLEASTKRLPPSMELARFTIRTPTGSRVVAMGDEFSQYVREHEILYGPNGRFRIVNFTEHSLAKNKMAAKRGIKRYYNVEVEYVPSNTESLKRIAQETLEGKDAMDAAFANAAEARKLPDVKDALDTYVEDEDIYAQVNGYLRGQGPEFDEELQAVVDGLDKGFANVQPLERNIIVYRGSPSPASLRVGQTIPHRGYMSTAYGEGTASDFAGLGLTDDALGPGNIPTMFKIRVPEGTRAWGLRGREAEIVLPRGGQLRIIQELPPHMVNGEPIRMLEVEYINSGPLKRIAQAPTEYASTTADVARIAEAIGEPLWAAPELAAARREVKMYTRVSADVQNFLRKGNIPAGASTQQFNERIGSIDKLFEAAEPLPRGVVLQRGGMMPTDILRVGAEFTDAGFTSTTYSTDIAERFLWDKDNARWAAADGFAPVKINISVPAGTRVVPLMDDAVSVHSGEYEVLLKRGGRYRVTGSRRVDVPEWQRQSMMRDGTVRADHYYEVDVELIPDSVPLPKPTPSALAQTIDVDEFPLAARGQLPSARGAEWKDLDNLPRARRFAADLDYDPDRFIQQSAVQEFEKILADDRFKIAKQQRTFFGIQTPDADLARVGIRNSDGTLRFNSVRTTANDLARAEAYAGTDGVTFEVIMPKGTRAVHTSVAGLEEWQLLPGTRYDVVSQTTRSGRPHYVLRLTDDGSAHTAKIIDFKHELARAAKRDWNTPVVQQVPRVVSKTVRHRLGPELRRGAYVTDAQVELAVKEATRLGISPRAVTFEPSLGRASAGKFEGRVLGEYRNGRISVVADQAERLQQTIAHEATHLRFEAARNADTKLLQDILEDLDGLMTDDGVTAYSRAHWQTAMAQREAGRQTAMLTAVEETLAEMEALQALGQRVGTARYRALLDRVDQAYRKASQNGIAVPRRARRDATRRALRRLADDQQRVGLTGAKANKHLTKLQKDIPALTEVQIEAHKQYQWYAYRPMNALLREYANDVDQFLSKSAWKGMDRATAVDLANANRVLQAHLEAMPAITEPVTVFRAIAPSGGRSYAEVRKSAAEWIERLQPGARLTDTGFISTTTDYRQAEKWLKKIELGVPDAPLSGIVFEVQLPPGTKGAWAPTVTPDIAAEVVVKNEFLLPPGGTFEVISTTHDTARNWLRVVVRYIARGQ